MQPIEWPDDVTSGDAPALDDLAAAGIGEGDFGENHHVPAELIELGEAIEYVAAVGDWRTDRERDADEQFWHGRHPGYDQ